jgi:predicted O-methyltransferase YrrM
MGSSPASGLLRQLGTAAWTRLAEGASRGHLLRPYMRPKEMAITEEILANLGPSRCLEWGSGYSTLWFSRLLGKDASWLAVEHDREWAGKVQRMNRDPNVTVAHVAPNRFPWTDGHGDGAPQDLKDYVEYPSRFEKYDFILVDGRARAACLVQARKILNADGVMVLHDANRAHYREALPVCRSSALFLDWRKDEGGLWAGTDGPGMERAMDVDRHRAIWRAHDVLHGLPLFRNLE